MRGGKRPGAGAPRGNINGLKHGRYSPRVQAAFDALLRNDDTRLQFARMIFAARPRATTRGAREKLEDLIARGNVVNADGDLRVNTPYYRRVEQARKLRAEVRRMRALVQRTLDRDATWRELMTDPALAPPPETGRCHSCHSPFPSGKGARGLGPAQPGAAMLPQLTTHNSPPETQLNQTTCSDPNLAQSNSDAWRRLAAIKGQIDRIIDERERTPRFVPILDDPLRLLIAAEEEETDAP